MRASAKCGFVALYPDIYNNLSKIISRESIAFGLSEKKSTAERREKISPYTNKYEEENPIKINHQNDDKSQNKTSESRWQLSVDCLLGTI